ncbi:hypothetical protein V8C43DRAFT_282217 [Trichoderma afarasin]
MSFYEYLYCTYAKRMVLLTDYVPRAGTRTFSPEEASKKKIPWKEAGASPGRSLLEAQGRCDRESGMTLTLRWDFSFLL